ncbi:MAG: MASE1 domain-containing protein, partial [Planktothrix sp.]
MNLFNPRVFRDLNPEISRIIIINIYLGIAYAIGTKISLSIGSLHGISAIWLPSGMTLAAFILFGSKIFPAIVFGSVMGLANVFNSTGSLLDIFILNIGCILGNYLQPFCATFVIKKYSNIQTLFISINGIIIFIITGFFSPIISAVIIIIVSVYTGFYPAENYWVSLLTIWIASGLTHLIFTPVFLINKIPSVSGKDKIKPRVKLFILLFVIIATSIIFWITFVKNYAVEYILLLLLILTVFTLGKKYSILMVAIVSSVAIIATALEFGPFVKASINPSLLLLQSFIGVFSVTALILSAIIDEKQQATNKLELTLANLENTVKERTLQLETAKEKA